MLAESIELDAVEFYLADDSWACQQKLDGDRVLVCSAGGEVTVLNREGEPRRNGFPRKVVREFAAMPGEMWFDGELVDGVLWLFDLPKAGEVVVPNLPYSFRLDVLERFFEGWAPADCVRLLPTARGVAAKRALFDQVSASRGEGVMFKHVDGLYRSGRRSRQVLKAKFTKTCDVIVTGVRVEGRENCHYSVVDGDRLVEVGSCGLQGKPAVQVGDVIEVRYLYCSDDRRLYQARMVRKRHDKSPLECTVDQLVFTDRSVIV